MEERSDDFGRAIKVIAFIFNILFLFQIIIVLSLVLFAGGSERGLAFSLLSFIPALLIFVCIIPFIFKKIFLKQTEVITPSTRYDSARKWLLAGITVDLLLMIAGWIFLGEKAFSQKCLILLAVPPIAGLLYGCFRPSGNHARKAGPYINSACLAGIFFMLLTDFAFEVTPRSFLYETADVERGEYVALADSTIRQMFPSDAKDIRIEGNTGLIGLGFHFRWTCRVSEDSVRRFFRKTKREWRENDPCFNMNPETNKEKTDYSGFLFQHLKELPESYLFYSYIYRNYGGWVMLYDRKTGTLYGSYSSN